MLRDSYHPVLAFFQWVDSGLNMKQGRPISIIAHWATYTGAFFPATVRLVAQDIKKGWNYL